MKGPVDYDYYNYKKSLPHKQKEMNTVNKQILRMIKDDLELENKMFNAVHMMYEKAEKSIILNEKRISVIKRRAIINNKKALKEKRKQERIIVREQKKGDSHVLPAVDWLFKRAELELHNANEARKEAQKMESQVLQSVGKLFSTAEENYKKKEKERITQKNVIYIIRSGRTRKNRTIPDM